MEPLTVRCDERLTTSIEPPQRLVRHAHTAPQTPGATASSPVIRIAQAADIAATPRLEFQVIRSVDVLPCAEEGLRFSSEVRGEVPPDDVSFAGRFTLRVELV